MDNFNVLQMDANMCQNLLDRLSPPDSNGAYRIITYGSPGQLVLHDFATFAKKHPNVADRKAYIGELKVKEAAAMMAAVDAMIQ